MRLILGNTVPTNQYYTCILPTTAMLILFERLEKADSPPLYATLYINSDGFSLWSPNDCIRSFGRVLGTRDWFAQTTMAISHISWYCDSQYHAITSISKSPIFFLPIFWVAYRAQKCAHKHQTDPLESLGTWERVPIHVVITLTEPPHTSDQRRSINYIFKIDPVQRMSSSKLQPAQNHRYPPLVK